MGMKVASSIEAVVVQNVYVKLGDQVSSTLLVFACPSHTLALLADCMPKEI